MIGRGRALAWSAVFLVGGFAASIVLVQLAYALLGPRLALPGGALSLAAVQSAAMVLIFGVLTWLIGRRKLGVTGADLGLVPVRRGSRGLVIGLGIGAAVAVVALALGVPVAGADWSEDGGTPGAWAGTVLMTGAVLLPAAFVEELMFRGAPLVALSRSFGRIPAAVGLSVCFGLVHLLNPGVTALGIANIVLAGVWLSVVFFTPGGLWAATGAHLGWNLTLAGLGAPVSGLPFRMPWLDYAPGSPAWLTGGSFGPEGGLLGTLCLLGGCVVAGRRVTQETIA